MRQQSSEHIGFDTLKVRAGYDPSEHHLSSQVPIYQSAAFCLQSPERVQRLLTFEESHPTYSRTANPTVEVLEKRLAALHGAPGAVALSSGMAAVSHALMNVVGAGGRVLSTYQLYGGTLDGFTKLYPQLGIGFDAVADPADLDGFARGIGPDTKAIFVESITNPLATVLDLEGIAALAHAAGIPLIVDNTIATPYLLNPFDFGADVVLYSATKALCGHGNALAGVILERNSFDFANGSFGHFTERLWALRDKEGRARSVVEAFPDAPFTGRVRSLLLNYLGASLSPFDAWLVLLGIDTLSERVAKQVASTQVILGFLLGDEHVAWVSYPSLPGNDPRRLSERYLPRGAGSVLSFGLKGSEARRRCFLESVRMFSYQANIGDARSLIVDPAQTTHYEVAPEQRELMGLHPGSLRLSLGLEDPADLIADLRQAFAAADQVEGRGRICSQTVRRP